LWCGGAAVGTARTTTTATATTKTKVPNCETGAASPHNYFNNHNPAAADWQQPAATPTTLHRVLGREIVLGGDG